MNQIRQFIGQSISWLIANRKFHFLEINDLAEISFLMLIFLLFSNHISGGGGKLPQGAPLGGRKPVIILSIYSEFA